MIFILPSFLLVIYGQSNTQLKKQIKDAGYNENTIKEMVKDQGYLDSQIDAEAKARGINLLENDISVQKSSLNINDQIENVLEIDTGDSLATIQPKDRSNIPYFGYNIFSGDPSAFQSSSFGIVDPNYNLGPGDIIIVMLWGESQFRQEFKIDREGYVFVPEVGQVFVNGLNLEALENKLFQILSKVYSTLNPAVGKPTTFMDISLGNLRPLRIIVLGEVSQPGAYSVSPSTSLTTSLYYFKGPTTQGSLRDIRLIRKGIQIGSIDFYDYLQSGNTSKDLRLQIDDIVYIPPRGKTVKVYGEITRKGIYELKKGEGIADLLKLAGGLLPSSYLKRAQIKRIVPANKRFEKGMDRVIVDINLENLSNDNLTIDIFDGDELQILSIQEKERNYVDITGSSVIREGRYEMTSNMTIMDLINVADGFTNNAYMDLAHIIRIKDDLTNEILSINLRKAMSNDYANNIKLKFQDKLIVYNQNILKNLITNVNIMGAVKAPGSYNFEKNKTLRDLIIEAGGFINNVNEVKISVARVKSDKINPLIYYFPSNSSNSEHISINDLTDKDNSLNSFMLKSNDYINIYSNPTQKPPDMISISGAVYYPGIYPILSKNEKVTDIINRAGGLLPEAYPLGSTFIRNNKSIQLSFEEILNNYRDKDNFIVFSGDKININKRPNLVQVLGEVNNPGVFKYYEGYSLKDYINIAGGATVNAELKEVWVQYPNGTSKPFRRYLPSPQVYDGSIISVGLKKESEPLDKTEFAKELASIISDFLNIYISLTILSRTASNI